MLNVVALMGRLVRDPELRTTPSGKSVASFTVACDKAKKDAPADFIPVTVWERTAEFVCKYFQKGSLIALDGRLQSRQYQDKNGNNRTIVEIVANNVHFCGEKKQSKEPDVTYTQGGNDDFSEIDDDEDLPF